MTQLHIEETNGRHLNVAFSPSGNDFFDLSKHDPETIVEISPNGRYAKLNTVLGKGAYKVVYKAIDREEGYEVAWNCFQTTKAQFNALSQEISILKEVRHPNIIAFHDWWYSKDNEFIFVAELMTSGTLREYIRKLSLPNMKIVKRWSRQILKGLIYLHSHDPPIIHRDIKCDNIFINGAHGEVKIGDMGTAKMKLGKKYTVIGTPEFMAPEMYDEKGYSEKVDIYAFGMCLLEMVTGEYPYNECKNAAQVYKKVIQGSRPECLNKVQDPEVLDLINHCIAPENERYTARQIVNHPFLLVEPEVVLLTMDPEKVNLSLQLVFKGMDKLAVKFNFNVVKDTAEEVVGEMIEEQVLLEKYKTLITHEINRILRELNKIQNGDDQNKEEANSLWPISGASSTGYGGSRSNIALTISPGSMAQTQMERNFMNGMISPLYPGMEPNRRREWLNDPEDSLPMREYPNDTPIEEFVSDTAQALHRDMEKARQWTDKLKKEDIMTVGDLRRLHDEDWAGIKLTVFATRALKNALAESTRLRSPRSTASTNSNGHEEGL
ncbi:5611_t:CDS:10 [Paraglomus brasilianum]|uniref:5611_t:CDS:1 n=1 Tax=Paraglomus brasilianum TaxID=144538 RepID=A0A9N9CZD7_9GLOM|nr:5611_t:CDS:10 [Paraglomus brasilianum]